jgi:hypothetical protein
VKISRQKLSGLLRKHGVEASKWSKGRVTWRASNGYDLQMVGFGGRAAEISYNVSYSFDWTDRETEKEQAGLAKIEAALEAEGLPYLREGKRIQVLDAR